MKAALEEEQVLLIDKPYDWTSFDVVRKLRSAFKISKIGHAGTLDPLATGLLILCTGKFTKKINLYMAQEKEYIGVIKLGATTPTYDLESIPENFIDPSYVNSDAVENAASLMMGETLQIPPIYSAIKKDGKRAYQLARKGADIELQPRRITISSFDTRLEGDEVHFRIVCSTGTYIRTIADDLGSVLGCGGYLASLCRTRIGEMHLKDALSIGEAVRKFTDKPTETAP